MRFTVAWQRRALPGEATHHRFRIDSGLFEDAAGSDGVGIVALSKFFGVNSGGNEQAVDAERIGAFEVGADRVADRQDPPAVGRCSTCAARIWEDRATRGSLLAGQIQA